MTSVFIFPGIGPPIKNALGLAERGYGGYEAQRYHLQALPGPNGYGTFQL